MINKLRFYTELFRQLKLAIITYLPGELGYRLRYKYWHGKLRYLGKGVKIDTGIYFQNPGYIFIDDNCWIDRNVIILAGIDKSEREKKVINNEEFKGEPGVVHIGKNIHVGPSCIISGISAGVYLSDDCGFSANCKLYAFSHHYRSIKNARRDDIHFGPMASQDRQCLIEGPIFIGSNTGVALNSIILPGVSIPNNCFVAVNSVVRHGKFSPNSIISGNPAKETGTRFI
jgi:acetyltransferase-like isoleucine patch superfamily enzyme